MISQQGILPRLISWAFFIFIAMAVILPQVRIFMVAPDPVPTQEIACAWSAAQRYVYKSEIERAFIRNWSIRRSSYGAGYYEIHPVTFFALPWRDVLAECSYNRQTKKLVPVGAWPADIPFRK